MTSPLPPPTPSRHPRATGSTALGNLTDDLLSEIFIRFDSPADLVRSSAACSPFLRVITDHSFLRRLHALHPPPLLSILEGSEEYIPASPPHPRALPVDGMADLFYCSFLPGSPESWRRRDFRDGRALFSRYPEDPVTSLTFSDGVDEVLRELLICDPFSTRYAILPAIPQHLTAFLEDQTPQCFVPFLAPAGVDEGTSYTVMYMASCKAKLVVFIFSSDAGQWRAVVFDDCANLRNGASTSAGFYDLSWRFHAHGCIYWVSGTGVKLLRLDTGSMQFSVMDGIRCFDMRDIVIVEAEEGQLGMFVLTDDSEEQKYELRYFIWQNNEVGVKHWQLVEAIILPLSFSYYNLIGTAGRYVILQGIPKDSTSSIDVLDHVFFSVDLKTRRLERFCGFGCPIVVANLFLFAGFPPSLSPPSI